MSKSLLLIFLLATIKFYSQENYNSESYKITLGDLSSKTFKKDSTANAFVIYEFGNSYVDKTNFRLTTEKKHKIKILNQEGFDQANIVIHLYNSDGGNSENVSEIIATTYNEFDGQVESTKLKEENIFKEVYDENHTIVKFTLPNIKPGSVLTYGYKITSPFMFKYHGWEFQGDIPKLYSQYNTSIPGYWDYHIKLVGGKKLAVNDSKIENTCLEVGRGGSADCTNSTYVMKDIPAFIEEDYSTTKQNYLARIDYELKTFTRADASVKHYTKSWKAVDKELRSDKDIGRQLRKSVDLEELLTPEIISETNPLKKAKAIYNYVQTHYMWNGDFKIFNDVSIKNLINSKSGNVSSINILLHNLLNESEIDAKPVFLSTRENGFPTILYPVLSDYNYLITRVTIGDKSYLLDATDKFLTFGQIPFRCLNQKGRLFDFKNESKWIDLKPNSKTATFVMAKFSLKENNQLVGKINMKQTGYHALSSKKTFFNNKDSYLNEIEDTHVNSEVLNFEAPKNNPNNPDFKANYELTHNLENIGGNIYLNPFLIKFFSENPFKLQERTYPIDFGYSDTYFYNMILDINNEYTIKELPKDVAFQLPNSTGSFVLSTKKVGSTINILFKINFNKPFYEPEYYDYLKEFMNLIVDAQNNSTILITKS
ncbi:DUF3857 and transglutaminase domain-containing protein [Tamlana agarivorans]|uniref:DUF3857 and transglutaminase domain-containing protein n=1 Tax=Pseudotamlana agarivorans TaxID=481183 RepID=A0ACC5UAZ8_9FLAO|nr:DUF3857 domain-containing protein [Tamlana agarivorans]MBU2951489.1 DUF3857 and transglutaminase domain-containing protein [Tamlana agarivorans]